MTALRRAFVIALVISALLSAQNPYKPSGSRHQYWVGLIPTTSTTVIVAGQVYLRSVTISVGAGVTGYVTLTDRGTDCGGIACPFFDNVQIAASATSGATYVADFGGAVAPGGLAIIATGGVRANIHYTTAPEP